MLRCWRYSTKPYRRHSNGDDVVAIHEYYRRAAWIVRAKVEANAAIRSNLVTAFRVSVVVPAFRWSTISWTMDLADALVHVRLVQRSFGFTS